MKQTLLITSLLVASVASAGFVPDPASPDTTPAVSQAATLHTLPDNSRVVLEGHIERKVRHEHYIFRDNSGAVEVEIDDDVWRGVDVTPRDKVRLNAEVDKEGRRTEIEVKTVEKLR